MRILILLLAVLAHGPALAGWFGPSDEEECSTEYAAKAATKTLVGWAMSQCRVAFDESRHDVLRDRALCEASHAPDMKTEAAIYPVRQACETENPAPSCWLGDKEFNFERDRCEVVCVAGDGWQVSEDGNSCVSKCVEGDLWWKQNAFHGFCFTPTKEAAPTEPETVEQAKERLWNEAFTAWRSKPQNAVFIADQRNREAMQRAIQQVFDEGKGATPFSEILISAELRARNERIAALKNEKQH